MVDYASLATIAQQLINENGRDVTITKLDRDANNPSQPWNPQTPTNTVVGPLKGVLVPFRNNDIDGTLVRKGDMKALVAANDTTPNLIEEFDELDDAGDIWKIVDTTVINPGPVRVIYKLTLRR